MTRYVYIETDHHANNKWGLLTPGTRVEGITPMGEPYEHEFKLNPEQRFLHAVRESAVKGVRHIVGDAPVTYLHLGDYVQGWKHPTDIITDSPYEELVIAQHNLRWLYDRLNIDKIRLVYGTAAHDGIRHEAVKSIKSMVAGYADDVELVWHGVATVDGVTIDYSHHGAGIGIRDWLKGNQIRYYVKSIMSEDLKRGKTPPRLMLRGHYHAYHWETTRERIGDKFVTTDYVLVPSLCGMGAFATQVTGSKHLIQNGSILLEIDGDKFHIHDWVVERDLRKKELL